MSLPALLLVAATAVQVVGPLFSYPRRGRRLLWLVILGLLGWQLWHDSLLLGMVPVYLLLVVMFLAFGYRSYRLWRGKSVGRRRWLRVVGVLLSLPFLAIPVLEATLLPLEPADYRQASWTDAFDGLHETLQQRYAFGEWKRVPWDDLYAEHYPDITKAARSEDREAYYAALRSYIFNLPDGHVSIYSDFHDEAMRAEIGGGFGFAALRLDGGRVIAHIVEAGGSAARAGMTWGAEILRWDNKPINEAVQEVPTLWASRPPATLETLSIARHQLLTRAPVGTERRVTFRNQGASQAQTVTLKARDDSYRTYEKSVYWQMYESPIEAVQYRILEDDIGYIHTSSLESSPNVLKPAEEMERAVQHMVDQNVQALILDVRGNRGGLDTLVPQIMSYFAPVKLHYEDISYYNRWVETLKLMSLHIKPNDLQFINPVTVLIDHRTKSSGEGFGLVAKRLPNANVVGMHATDGSFGMSSASVFLPEGIEVGYPWGQSLDKNGVVQVDSNHALEGGVQPDVLVPLTFETAEAIYLGNDDVVLEFAHDLLQKQLQRSRASAPN